MKTGLRHVKRRVSRALAVCIGLLLTTGLRAGDCPELQKITPAATGSEHCGAAVSIDGEAAVIGCPTKVGSAALGSAWVYRRNTPNGAWEPQQQLLASNGQPGDAFGTSVSISGSVIVVGAPGADTTAQDAGAAYVFRYDGSAWVEQQQLVPTAAVGDQYGQAVSVHGDHLVIGGWLDDVVGGADAGSAQFFRYEPATSQWHFVNRFEGDGEFDRFGYAVAMGESIAVIGAPFASYGTNRSGAAYVYSFDGNVWTKQQVLISSKASIFDKLGWSVSISGDVIVVGAPFDDNPGSLFDGGAAYVYSRGASGWNEEQRLTASNTDLEDEFGWSVSVNGEVVAVGAIMTDRPDLDSGSAYIFRWMGPTCGWIEDHQLIATAPGGQDWLGHSVCVSGDHALVGAMQDDTPAGNDAGSASIYAAADVAVTALPNPVPGGQPFTVAVGYGDAGEVFLLAAVSPVYAYALLTYGHDCTRTVPVPAGLVPPGMYVLQAFELRECPKDAVASTPLALIVQ